MKRLLFIILLGILLMGVSPVSGQDVPKQKTKSDFFQRLRFGGYLGLQFGTYTAVDISPMVIYRANNWLYPGVGFSYMYFRNNNLPDDYNSSSYWGPRIFSSFYIWQGLFAHAEYEALHINYPDIYQPYKGFIHNFLLGGGYRQMIGNRAFATITVLYNFNESVYSPYRNPIVRIGFGVGL